MANVFTYRLNESKFEAATPRSNEVCTLIFVIFYKLTN